jgi:STE24 endopeptidase
MLWLNFRQNKAIISSINAVPNEFKEKITLAQHQKAAKYTKAKLSLNYFEVIFSTLILLIWTIGGGVDYIDSFWQKQSTNTLNIGVGFMLSIIIISSIIDLPFSIYKTFVLEEKFGFNKVTAKIFIADLLKNSLLITIIYIPLLYAILYLMNEIKEYWWLYAWFLMTGFMLLMMWLYPTCIAPIFNKFKPLNNEDLKQKINNLLNRTGFKSDGIFVMDGSKRSSHGNAYFTGIGKNKRIVFFDTLLKGMEDKEIEAILAHELGHFHHKHVRKGMINLFITMLIGFALLGFLIKQEWFFVGLGVSEVSNHAALILFSFVIPVFIFFIAPIKNYLSRKHEFEADYFAAKHTNADDLISSLVKLYRDNSATLTPDNLYSCFHDSHPSASIRINHLKKVKNN